MKYARLIFALFALAGWLNGTEEELYYRDAFFKAMRLSSIAPLIEAELQCKKGGRNFIFDPYSRYGYNKEIRDKTESDFQRLKESGISSDTLFFVEFSERQKKDDKVILSDVGILHADSPSRFHF
ncbi:MAG: hypothetical protein LBO72_00820 [Helicobacteraceae bacterium]|jgi:hypothetical protein|nr:hypothetical protein [Helicobacteraceae bacterium]